MGGQGLVAWGTLFYKKTFVTLCYANTSFDHCVADHHKATLDRCGVVLDYSEKKGVKMKKLREVNLSTTALTLCDVHVTSAILPKTTGELSSNISISGEVVIDGAVYANNIEVSSGTLKVLGALYCNNELHIKNDFTGSADFSKAVASANSVAALLTTSRVTFGSDLNAPIIKLKNAFVAGSIYGTDVSLENCVVLGGVFSSKNLSIANCVIGTFCAMSVLASGENFLLYPAAFSTEEMQVTAGGKWWDLALADLGSLFKGEEVLKNTGKILLSTSYDCERTVLTDDTGAQTLVNSYSVASRVLISDLADFDKLKNHFLIAGAALGEQLLKSYNLTSTDGEKTFEVTQESVANFFFDVLKGKIEIKALDGKVSMEELEKVYG